MSVLFNSGDKNGKMKHDYLIKHDSVQVKEDE